MGFAGIDFLGHRVEDGRIFPLKSKIEVLIKYSRPSTIRQLKAFLGLVSYYRRFIKNCSAIASPLHRCLERDNINSWDEECQQAFDFLRNCLTIEIDDMDKFSSNPDFKNGILLIPDLKKPFRLETDASEFGAGAVLSQKLQKFHRPVAYWSKHFKRERKMSTPEKELAALVFALEHFQKYLLGAKFTVLTDHQPLTWLKNLLNPAPCLTRWLIRIRVFDFDIEFREGKANGNADALSRWLLEKDVDETEKVDEDSHLHDFVVNAITLQPNVH